MAEQKNAKKTPPPVAPTKSEPMEALMAMIKPLLTFHADAQGASEEDLRIFWDVRVVRGNDEHWQNVTGSATLPGALRPSRLRVLAAMIQDEIESKISAPLVAAAQDYAESAAQKRMDAEIDDLERKGEGMKAASERSQLMLADAEAHRAEQEMLAANEP